MAIRTSRSLRRGLTPSEPMPRVEALAQLYKEYGQPLRAGQIAMISGRRGSQKSGFGMWLVDQWNLPTLYINADMSQWTADSRLIALRTGHHKDQVEEALLSPDVARRDEVRSVTDGSNIAFMHSSRPPLDDVDEELDAWVEMWDAFPRVIVVDNLMDMEPLNESEYQNLVDLLQEFKTMARTTNALVLVLHHNKDGGDSGYPADLEALKGKVSMTPETILSVALENQPSPTMPFRLAVTKQREGNCSPKADRWIELIAEPDRTLFAAPTFYQQAVPLPPSGGNTWGS